ncbi:hypothetical protein EVG20_g11079 [Dentipellis fragilis]|uniref:HMG box domain-containing protein n=1 Tax=Dentipellis fragilis TaxID=205917 RepID=A0A4Y9XNC9_9AGAM|nr:hypothetical protein EVG20_g11079 [Dentipellis fragilis]
MSDSKPDAAQLELRKQQLIGSLGAVAGAMRECAGIADQFVQMLGGTPLTLNGTAGPFTLTNAKFGEAATATPAAKGRKRKGDDADTPGDGPKKRRVTKRAPRDPNAPRRPPSSYLYFQNEVRARAQEQEWTAMSHEDREVYEAKQAAAKDKYIKEKAVYDANVKADGEAEAEAASAAAAAAEAEAEASASSPLVEEPATPESEPAAALRALESASSASEDDEESDDSEDDEEPAVKPTSKSKKAPSPEPTKKKSKKAKA